MMAKTTINDDCRELSCDGNIETLYSEMKYFDAILEKLFWSVRIDWSRVLLLSFVEISHQQREVAEIARGTGTLHIDKTFETITEREMWCQWNHAIKCYCMRFLDWGNLRRFELDFLSLLTFHFNKSSGKNITKENECDVQTKISWIGTIFNSILLSLSRFDV